MKRPFLKIAVKDSVKPIRIKVVDTIMLVMTANSARDMELLTMVL